MSKYSVVYMITNKINNKSYIGKTKSHYGEKPYGIERRFKTHLYNAIISEKTYKNHNDCPKLYNAIRKYGKDNFNIIELIRCDKDMIDFYEKEMIKAYNTIENGYNIAKGGRGRSVVNIDDDIRKKLSHNKDGILNILEVKNKDGILRGYKVRRVVNGKEVGKKFTNKYFTIEENLKLAEEFLHKLKNNEDYKSINNKELPQYIKYQYHRKTKEKIGYCFEYKGKNQRTITTKKLSMEEKFKIICDYKDSFFSNNELNETLKEAIDNPQPSS